MSDFHDGQHYGCAECFKVKLRTVRFDTVQAMERRKEDRTFSADMDAYARLRRSGVQPKSIGGSAEVEAQASTKFEAEHKVIMSPQVRREFIPRIEDAR